jgi:hypothetical protein
MGERQRVADAVPVLGERYRVADAVPVLGGVCRWCEASGRSFGRSKTMRVSSGASFGEGRLWQAPARVRRNGFAMERLSRALQGFRAWAAFGLAVPRPGDVR